MALDETRLYEIGLELNRRAATTLPRDVREAIRAMAGAEAEELSRTVLGCIADNWEVAEADARPLCADTGLPRFYARCGNDAALDGGFAALERALRRATAESTRSIPLRPNRVHPLTRSDPDNNVGAHAPSITYAFEPEGDWIDLTAVHRGGLFGADYRMLFPNDGIEGIRRFFLECIGQSFQRGLSCPPVIVGVGLGGTKDDCFRLGQEAACLRCVGDRHPDPEIAALEEELTALGNAAGFGPMGYAGSSAVMDVHIEIAYAHTGGLPVGLHHFCFAARRSTARIHPDGRAEYREDPRWFTEYYRRETI
jgi:L(+)-tartrate dehydratase alpha subunit